ncbi:hypothetical protein LSTR_LSTR006310 [Laodelphax striatellus]|uniref:ADAM10 endopeptidase n=1 Tax=Laodelphax striatellus TaxID=195883 RepID=A0A482XPW0_LAOST|nr:hypothetical protein LSTR_LSTR006310 [Laodelphax striatellus]
MNDDDAVVKGVVTSEGLFDGTISTQADDYFVEPVSRYADAFPNHTPAAFHTVVYRRSDVRWPPQAGCASHRLHVRRKKKKRRRRWLVLDDLEVSTSAKTVVNITSPDTVYHLGNRTSLPELPPRHDSTLNIRIVKVGPNSTIIRSTKTSDLLRPPPKILVGTGDEGLAEDDWLLTRQQQLVSKRAAIDERKTTCMLYLQADHLFYHKYGTEEACIEVMTRHVQRVNSIYKVTDFNQDGRSDNISFMIKRIKVHSSEAVEDPKYRFPGNYGVEKFLELFSEEDYDAFCLAYMFTYRDFEMGTLGLAWTGDLKNAGGVCEKNGHYRGSMKSLNTGIVTLLNYGKHVPPAVSHVTLAHEIGHNFGSPHDPEICTPGGEDGNFIMFARATSGDKKNNNKFSPCSLNSINPVLNVKARSPKGCFTEPQAAICGNGVVDPGEQCDCGWEEECRDSCCYPQRLYPPPDETPCRLTPNSMCSPSQGPCCTPQCQLKFGDKCRDDNGCRDSSYCDGRGPHCPPSINKPNKTVCNEEFVCFMGECTGSICLAYGLESCQCLPGPHDPPTKACELCCKLPGENQPCLSSFAWNSVPYDIPDMFSKPGTPCNDYNGYCDVFQKCREVDPSGPLATLRKLLLSEESIASFRKWITARWYLAVFIFSSVLFTLILSTRLLGKTTDVKLQGMKIIHSSTTETVRLPPETDGNGGNVVVHPVAVRSKLPLNRRVDEGKRGRRQAAKRGEDASPQRKAVKKNQVIAKDKKKNRQVARKVIGKKKSGEVIDYSSAQSAEKTPEDDPLGKVRNWLMNSHNLAGTLSIRKSKSSPAGFSQTAAPKVIKPKDLPAPPNITTTKPVPETKTSAPGKTVAPDATTGAKNSDPQVKLQVVYKPPFKFSVKLRKPAQVATTVVKEINSKVSQRQQQRAGVVVVKGGAERRRNNQRGKSKSGEGEESKKSNENVNVNARRQHGSSKATSPEKKSNDNLAGACSDVKRLSITEQVNDFVPEDDQQKKKKQNRTKTKDNDTVMLIPAQEAARDEPIYQNTNAVSCSKSLGSEVDGVPAKVESKPDKNVVDLLRMTSVECRNQSQHPVIVPEDCKDVSQTSRISRSQSQQSRTKIGSERDGRGKRTKREHSREKSSSRLKPSSPQKSGPDLMRFPSTEPTVPQPSSTPVTNDVPKVKTKIPAKPRNRTSFTEDDASLATGAGLLHTVPSDLEVLLSESEYLFSDA